MPNVFEKINLNWKGRDYVIQPDDVLQCIAKIEDVITLADLHRYGTNAQVPLAKLSMAYGAVLRHAGAVVDADEVYAAMFKGADMQRRTAKAIETLLLMMIPPETLRKSSASEQPVGKARAASGSSKRPTRQP
jgi:hypothetical protein